MSKYNHPNFMLKNSDHQFSNLWFMLVRVHVHIGMRMPDPEIGKAVHTVTVT